MPVWYAVRHLHCPSVRLSPWFAFNDVFPLVPVFFFIHSSTLTLTSDEPLILRCTIILQSLLGLDLNWSSIQHGLFLQRPPSGACDNAGRGRKRPAWKPSRCLSSTSSLIDTDPRIKCIAVLELDNRCSRRLHHSSRANLPLRYCRVFAQPIFPFDHPCRSGRRKVAVNRCSRHSYIRLAREININQFAPNGYPDTVIP